MEWRSRTHQRSATLAVWKINRYKSRRKFQKGLHDGVLIEQGGGAERTDRLDSADDRTGCIEGEERDVPVGDNSIENVKAGYGHHRRGRRVYGVPTE